MLLELLTRWVLVSDFMCRSRGLAITEGASFLIMVDWCKAHAKFSNKFNLLFDM